MNLIEIQRSMAAAIFRPMIGNRVDPEVDASFIRPGERMTAAERLEIYIRTYWSRVLDSLREDFPGLRAVVGRNVFDRLARAYLTELPSRSWTLRDLGARLESWLPLNPAYAGRCPRLAMDMTRLELAHIGAFDAAELPPIGAADLDGIGDDSKLTLQPHLLLLDVEYPVDDLLVRIRAASDLDKAGMRRIRGAVRYVRSKRPEPVFIAVHRVSNVVQYRRLAPEEFAILQKISCGQTIGQAIAPVVSQSLSQPESFGNVESWFASWSRAGWLCLPRANEESHESAAC